MTLHLPGFFKRDIPRKLVAIFFAVLIWLAVDHQLRDFETFDEVPVALRYQPDKIALDRRVVTVSIILRGARRRLQYLASTDIKITAEVPVVREGVYFYDLHLSPDNVVAPPGTRVTSIYPESIRVQLDRVVSRELPVSVRESGELAYGFQVLGRQVVPSTIEVSGPSRIVNDVTEIVTNPIVLDDTLEHSFVVDNVKLITPPRIELRPQTVHVSYDIARRGGQQTFTDLPLEVLGVTHRRLTVKGKLPTATVRVRGPKQALDALQPHAVHPFLDISDVSSPGTYTFAVRVWLDDPGSRLSLEYVHPAEMAVDLENGAPEPPPEAPDDPLPE